MALQGAVLSATRELLNSVSRRSDRRVQLLTVGNFEKIWNLDKILVHVMHFIICDQT